MREELFLNIIKKTIPESASYIGNDAAWVPEKDLILTQDTLIEDIHFRMRTISPFYLGRKAIAVNLSDIAASGGIPLYILISLSMPKSVDETFVREFYKGVDSICKEYNVIVVGGDLTAAREITVSICAIGSSGGLMPAFRSNAKPGNVVIVTGNFGSSSAGLYLLEESIKKTNATGKIPKQIRTKFIEAHINPAPKIKEGRKILELEGKPAIMDSSDGLGDALYKICLLSNVAMAIEFDEIPYDSDIFEVINDENTVKNSILFGGEDYQLVATVSPENYEKLKQEISVKKIGIVKQANNNSFAYVKFKDAISLKIDSEALSSGSFQHFE